ncbi:methyltransferase TRM13-domain-containing protein [Haematococcus lacustris]
MIPMDTGSLQAGPDSEAGVWRQFRGLAVATCCHHRCAWRPFVGKTQWVAWGFTPQEFELVSWMTGWALCGHDTPAGAAHADCSPAAGPEEVELPTADDANADIGESRSMTGSEAWDPRRSLPRSTRMDVGAKAKLLIDRARLVWLCHRLGLQPPPTGSDDTQAPAHLMWGSSTASGRCARLVQYVPSTVTGENKLLLCSLRI